MRTLVQRTGLRPQIDAHEPSGHATLEAARDLTLETWDKTDRPFRFPQNGPRQESREGASASAADDDPALARWLEEHDIETEFLDAGIGCCWFAQQGDREPVAGETEEEAVARLVQVLGLR